MQYTYTYTYICIIFMHTLNIYKHWIPKQTLQFAMHASVSIPKNWALSRAVPSIVDWQNTAVITWAAWTLSCELPPSTQRQAKGSRGSSSSSPRRHTKEAKGPTEARSLNQPQPREKPNKKHRPARKRRRCSTRTQARTKARRSTKPGGQAPMASRTNWA